VRLTFLVVIFPVVIGGLIFLFRKFKFEYKYLLKRLVGHSLIVIIIIVFLVILCWPHMLEVIKIGNFTKFFLLVIKNTVSWIDGPKIGLINGQYYEIFNTPKRFFLDIEIINLFKKNKIHPVKIPVKYEIPRNSTIRLFDIKNFEILIELCKVLTSLNIPRITQDK